MHWRTLLQENVALIREINELRREIKSLKHAGGKPAGSIGAGWTKPPRRSTKEAKQDSLPLVASGSVTHLLLVCHALGMNGTKVMLACESSTFAKPPNLGLTSETFIMEAELDTLLVLLSN